MAIGQLLLLTSRYLDDDADPDVFGVSAERETLEAAALEDVRYNLSGEDADPARTLEWHEHEGTRVAEHGVVRYEIRPTPLL